MIKSSARDVTKNALLCVEENAVRMDGVWPGRYGAVALLSLTHSMPNVMEATLKIGPMLKKMDRKGGQETTQTLFAALDEMGVETFSGTMQAGPSDMGKAAFIDGREMFELLEMEALEALARLGGYVSMGPFVVTAKLLPEQLKHRMARISAKYNSADGEPDTSDFT